MGQIYWILQLLVIFIFSSSYIVLQMGDESRLSSPVIRDSIYKPLKALNGRYTDLKFKIRGVEQPRAKVTIVGIDDESLAQVGRWPWERSEVAMLIVSILESGAKVVGFDMVFPEGNPPVPEELGKVLESSGFGPLVAKYATDSHFEEVLEKYKDRIVLGWASDATCRPLDNPKEKCPADLFEFPEEFKKFALKNFEKGPEFAPLDTPLMSMANVTPNFVDFRKKAQFSGSFNAFQDPDGTIRGTNLVVLGKGQAFPTLPLAMVLSGGQETVALKLDDHDRVQSFKLEKSNKEIPVTSRGTFAYNFLGPAYTFRYVSAIDVLPEEWNFDPSEKMRFGPNKEGEATRAELFQDAYVLIGAEAQGLKDMRSFPFDHNTPGVEGHATAVENILSGAFITKETPFQMRLIFLAMVLVGLLLAFVFQKLSSIPLLLCSLPLLIVIGGVDQFLLFNNKQDWSFLFSYLELIGLSVVAVGIKYVSEEKEKKYIQGAFGKYVSPAVVSEIVKDPAKLSLGGEKKNLSILFSDIRSFTSFSERLEAPVLGKLLNEYLGTMTEIIVDKREGTLDKYIGDAIMAFWGAPLPMEDHAKKSIQSAIDMQLKLISERPKFQKDYDVDVQVGIGINSGLVNVGNLGSAKNFAYTVIGDHVNLASRVEGLTKYYGASILTTGFTLEEVPEGERPHHLVLDRVKVKGKENAIELVQIFPLEPPKEYLELYKEAYRFYVNRDFQKSLELFKQAAETANSVANKDMVTDVSAGEFQKRCQEYLTNPPPEGWDGSYQMDKK